MNEKTFVLFSAYGIVVASLYTDNCENHFSLSSWEKGFAKRGFSAAMAICDD